MLQIDHVYEFLYQELFKDFEFWSHPDGVITSIDNITFDSVSVFTPVTEIEKKIFLGQDIIGRKETYSIKKLDNTFPDYIIKNIDQYRDWISTYLKYIRCLFSIGKQIKFSLIEKYI